MFDLFIFDFDGTIADSRLSISKSVNYALEQNGFAPVDVAEVYPLIGKLMIDETFLHFQPNLSAAQLADVIADFRFYQREYVKRDVTYFPKAYETLQALRAQGKTLAILSNKAQKALEDALNAFEYSPLFDVVIGSGKLDFVKPDRACVEHIWGQFPTLPERTVMIGDSEMDLRTAKNAGIKMIAVNHGTDSAEKLQGLGAEYAIGSLSELLNFSKG